MNDSTSGSNDDSHSEESTKEGKDINNNEAGNDNTTSHNDDGISPDHTIGMKKLSEYFSPGVDTPTKHTQITKQPRKNTVRANTNQKKKTKTAE